MKLARKTGISTSAVVLIIVGSIVGILAVFYVYGQTQASFCCNVRTITIENMTFNATTKTLNFTLNNPMGETTVSSVKANQMSCSGNFALIKAGALTSESCSVSGSNANFTKGETVSYIMSFANGQHITGSVTAQ